MPALKYDRVWVKKGSSFLDSAPWKWGVGGLVALHVPDSPLPPQILPSGAASGAGFLRFEGFRYIFVTDRQAKCRNFKAQGLFRKSEIRKLP